MIPLGVVWFLVWSLAVTEAGAGEAVVAVLLGMEAAVAIAVGVAVTRYRLYEIDRLINRTVVYGVVTALLGLVYALVSILGGVAVGRGSTWVTALAVIVVAAAFGPLRSRAQAVVDWRFDRARYEGLRRVRAFVDDVREGRREPEEVGTWSRGLRDPSDKLLFRLPGANAYAAAAGTPTETRSSNGARNIVARDGDSLSTALKHAFLARQHRALRASVVAIEIARLRVEVRLQLAEVEESRAKVVRAGYEERRRLERDLHDGAQQRLVTLGIVLRRMQRSLPREAQILGPALGSAVDEVGQAIEDLRTIAAGVRPPRLDEGLAAALADLVRAAPVSVDLEATDARLPEEVEAAAYFVVCEAVTNAVKHGSPSRVRVEAIVADGGLKLVVVDDGSGGATIGHGSGLVGLADRVEAQGGTLLIHSPVGAGTRIEVEIPCES